MEGSRSADDSLRPGAQEILHPPQIFLGINPHRVVCGLGHVNRDSVLQETQLLQTLAAFERGLGKRDEAVQRRFAIGVEAKMLEILRSGAITVARNRCAGKIESSP